MTQNNVSQQSEQPTRWLLLIVFFGIISRLIPHLPNMTPLISLSIIASLRLNRWCAMGAIMVILLISDSLLSLLLKYPILSHWSYFTYSGFLLTTVLFSYQTKTHFQSLLINALIGSLVFWVWTNFGVWLTSGLYAKTMTGFGLCYFVALPFLRNAIIGSIGWMCFYYFSLYTFFKAPANEIAH